MRAMSHVGRLRRGSGHVDAFGRDDPGSCFAAERIHGQAQIDHFVSQVNYFEDLYAGVYPAESATLLARGAVYGQMLGISAELDYFV
jgi:hypothetical protein